MPRRTKQEQADTLRNIRRTAFRLFGTFGYDGVSIGHIAKDTNLSKGALYWHFQGKDELYIDCLRELHAIFYEHIFDPMQATDDAVARTLKIFEGLARMAEDPRIADGVAGYWMESSRAQVDVIRQTQRDFEARTEKIIIDTLQKGADAGQFRFDEPMDSLARAVVAIIESIVLPLRTHNSDEIHEMLAIMARIFFRAYAAEASLIGMADKF